jgi:YHS domain-containing protein
MDNRADASSATTVPPRDIYAIRVFTIIRALFPGQGEPEMISVEDPVCGKVMAWEDAAVTHRFKGRLYYFCSRACHEKFGKRPGRFRLSRTESAVKDEKGSALARLSGNGEHEGTWSAFSRNGVVQASGYIHIKNRFPSHCRETKWNRIFERRSRCDLCSSPPG